MCLLHFAYISYLTLLLGGWLYKTNSEMSQHGLINRCKENLSSHNAICEKAQFDGKVLLTKVLEGN